MKIMNLPPQSPNRGLNKPTAEKHPVQMDQFELQQEIWESKHELAAIRSQVQSGQTRAVAGMGVLFTSLGIMAAQSALSGGLGAAQMIPVAVGAATGVTLFASGLWKRDTNEMNVMEARMNVEHLQAVYDKRFPS